MRASFFCRAVCAVVVTATIAGCRADSATAPLNHAPSNTHASALLAPVTVHPLQRSSTIAGGSTTAWVTPWTTTTLSIPGTGATVVVPPLAVSAPLQITMTAVAGSDVAYEFAPSGLHFTVPLVMTQDLHNTDAHFGGFVPLSSLFVGYFHDGDPVTLIQEILPVTTNGLTQTGTATIWHFSGYIWASGDSEEL